MFEEKMANLKRNLIEYAGLVENMIDKSTRGIIQKNKEMLDEVINIYEKKVNNLEIEFDELCINIIAQYAPKGRELRTILMILEMNKDFERIGDHTVNISQSGQYIIEKPKLEPLNKISEMAEVVKRMFSDVINSFINNNPGLAISVCERDKVVDNFNLCILKQMISMSNSKSAEIEHMLHIIRVAHNLERIADLSTNICEDVIYSSSGTVIKHHKDMQDKIKVLFVCTHNSARSQMAEAFLKKLGGNKFDVMSAGLEAGVLNPLAVEVMKEIGIDISKNKTKSVFDLYKQGEKFHYVIAVCDKETAEKCPIFPGMLTKTINWSFEDPSQFTGTEEEKLNKARQLRDTIKKSVENFIKEVQ